MNNIVKETLESLADYSPKIVQATKKLITFFREEYTLKAFELFPSYIEGLNWVIKAFILINEQENLLNIDIEAINTSLIEINEGIAQNDYVLIADILEYEILPFLEKILINIEG